MRSRTIGSSSMTRTTLTGQPPEVGPPERSEGTNFLRGKCEAFFADSSCRGRLPVHGKTQDESRPGARLPARVQVATVHLGDAEGDGKAEARAAAAALGREEGLEDAREHLLRDPGPGVGHGHLDPVGVRLGGDHDRAAVRYRLLRVRDEVEQDLLQLARARDDERRHRAVAFDDLDLLRRARAPDELDGLGHDLFERDDAVLIGALAGEIEQGANDLLDLEARLLDKLEPVVRLRAGLRLLEQELDEPEDGEERVVDLVSDPGGELSDRRELGADEELLFEVAALAQVGDERDRGG